MTPEQLEAICNSTPRPKDIDELDEYLNQCGLFQDTISTEVIGEYDMIIWLKGKDTEPGKIMESYEIHDRNVDWTHRYSADPLPTKISRFMALMGDQYAHDMDNSAHVDACFEALCELCFVGLVEDDEAENGDYDYIEVYRDLAKVKVESTPTLLEYLQEEYEHGQIWLTELARIMQVEGRDANDHCYVFDTAIDSPMGMAFLSAMKDTDALLFKNHNLEEPQNEFIMGDYEDMVRTSVANQLLVWFFG